MPWKGLTGCVWMLLERKSNGFGSSSGSSSDDVASRCFSDGAWLLSAATLRMRINFLRISAKHNKRRLYSSLKVSKGFFVKYPHLACTAILYYVFVARTCTVDFRWEALHHRLSFSRNYIAKNILPFTIYWVDAIYVTKVKGDLEVSSKGEGELGVEFKNIKEVISIDLVDVAVCQCAHAAVRLPHRAVGAHVLPKYIVLA